MLVGRHVLENPALRIVAVVWNGESDASLPLIVFENGALLFWDVARDKTYSLALRRTLRLPSPTTGAVVASQAALQQVAFQIAASQIGAVQQAAPSGVTLATCRESGQICWQRLEWNAGAGTWKSTVLKAIQAHRGRVVSLAIAGARLYSAGSDGTVVLTPLPEAPGADNGESPVIFDGLGALSCLSLSPDGGWLALGGDDGQVQIWQLDDKGTPTRLDWATGKTRAPIRALGFAPNGNMLMIQDAQGCCCLRAARTGHELQRMAQPFGAPLPAFAPDSRLLALVNARNGIDLVDAWTGNLRHCLAPIDGNVQALSFAPNAKTDAPETRLVVASSQQLLAWKVAF